MPPAVRRPEVYARDPYASVFDISHTRAALGYGPQSDRRRLFDQVPIRGPRPVRELAH